MSLRPDQPKTGRRPVLAAVLAMAAVLLAACTGGSQPDGATPTASPSPSQGTTGGAPELPELADVAIVLPARNARPDAEIEHQRDLVEGVAAEARATGIVDEVRIVVPDRFSTIGDVLVVLAEEGYDLVCALGPGAARGVREVAARFPATKFCATPGRLPEVAENTLIFDLRVEEAAYLAGIAARFAAPGVPAGRGREPALVFGDPAQGPRLRPPFDEGFRAVRPDPSTTALLVATDEESARAAAASQFDAGAFLVYTSAGRAELGVVEAAVEADGLVVGWQHWLRPVVPAAGPGEADESDESEGPDAEADDVASEDDVVTGPAWNLLLFEEDLSTALRDALTELAAGWTGGSRSLGFANGALRVVPGTSPVWDRVRVQVLSTQDAIIRGDLTVAPG